MTIGPLHDSWRRVFASIAGGEVTTEQRLQVLQSAANEVAIRAPHGQAKIDAVDALHELQLAFFPEVDDDVIQEIFAGAFERAEQDAGVGFQETCAAIDERHKRGNGETPPWEEAKANNGKAQAEEPKTERAPWTVPALKWQDPATIPRRQFLYGHCYARGFVSATVADGGIGKSILKIAEALSIATGLNLLGLTPTERVRVLYWNGDDPYHEVERRIYAACEHYRIDARQLLDEGWLFVGTRDKQPLCIAEMKGRVATLNQPVIEDICSFIRENNIGFACFDPLRSVHRVPENSNDDMDIIGDAFNVIAERANTAIGLDHHIRKPAFGQGEATTSDARGATALINKVRLSRVCNIMTPQLAEQARVKEDDRRRHFRVDSGKGNIAPPGKATWFKIISVPCPNGEDTPVVVSWKFPGVFDSITADHMHRVRAAAANGVHALEPAFERLQAHVGADQPDHKELLLDRIVSSVGGAKQFGEKLADDDNDL
jgi:hypothetical protein